MVFINATQSLGGVLYYSITNITGSLFLTLFFIVLFIYIIALAFRIPEELSAVIVLPLLIDSLAYSGDIISVAGVFLIYIAFIFTKLFLG